MLTDEPPAEGDFSIVSGAEEVEISGGQFVIGSSFHASHFINGTADVASRAFKKEGKARKQQLVDQFENSGLR